MLSCVSAPFPAKEDGPRTSASNGPVLKGAEQGMATATRRREADAIQELIWRPDRAKWLGIHAPWDIA